MPGPKYTPGQRDVWRTGDHHGRAIYGPVGDGRGLIGVMDTPELAQRVVDAVNNSDGPRAGRCGDEPPIFAPAAPPPVSCCSLDFGHPSEWREDEALGSKWRKSRGY